MEPGKHAATFRSHIADWTRTGSRLAVASLLLTAGTVVAQRTVWIVDSRGGTGVHFTDIPPAIAAARSGDRIEVRGSAIYSAIVLTKGMDLEATGGAVVPGCSVGGVPPGEWARVSGFVIDLNLGGDVELRNCQGPVLLGSIRVQPAPGKWGMWVNNCSTVLIQDSSFTGGTGSAPRRYPPAIGVFASDSRVVFQRSRVAGGDDGSYATTALPSAPGLFATNCELFAADTEFVGGAGAPGYPGLCWPPSAGGDGASVTGLALFMARCRLTGGTGGLPATGCGGSKAADGAALRGSPATRVTSDCVLTGATHNVVSIPVLPALASPVSVGRGLAATFTWTGSPNTVLLPLLARRHAHLLFAGIDGVLLLPPAGLVTLPTLTIGPTGSLAMTIPIPNDPALADEFFVLQGLAFEPAATQPSFTNAGGVRIR